MTQQYSNRRHAGCQAGRGRPGGHGNIRGHHWRSDLFHESTTSVKYSDITSSTMMKCTYGTTIFNGCSTSCKTGQLKAIVTFCVGDLKNCLSDSVSVP